MKNRKILISLIISIIMLVTVIGHVNAASYSFTFTANPTQISAKLGDTITVNLGIADIDQDSDGINAIQGDMSYDEELFESVEIVSAGNNWTVSLNDEENNDLKGRFVISNMNSIKDTGAVAILKAKIKSDATVSTGEINLENVFSSYGITETAKSNKTVTVNIEKEQNNNEDSIVPDNNSGSTTQNKPVESQGTTTQTSNKNSTTSNVSSLPKAGLSSWIVVGILISVIGAIIVYIRYKKIY